MTNRVNVIPIQNIVFFPQTALPVFVIEAAYVEMVLRSIENKEMIAISNADNLNPRGLGASFSPHTICTMGRAILLETLPDHSIKILVYGEVKIQLVKVLQNIPYLVYQYKPVLDPAIVEEGPLGNRVEKLKEILDTWIEDSIEDSVERQFFKNAITDLNSIIGHICMYLVHDIEIKQILLETNGLVERIRILDSLFKGDGEYQEDTSVIEALKSFKNIEYTSKFAH